MNKIKHGHQGDVLLMRVSDKKPDGKPVVQGRIILAQGEVTGHAHVMEAEGIAEFIIDGRRMIWVEAPTTIHHEEHDFEAAMGKRDVIERGLWQVVQQWDEWTRRAVSD